MSEELQRTKAKRAGNRAVITKLTKEADNIIKELQEHGLPLDSSNANRLHTIYAMLEEFIALGVFSTELLACQVSMICAANWPR